MPMPAVGGIPRFDVLPDAEKIAPPVGIDVGDSSAVYANLDFDLSVAPNIGSNNNSVGFEKRGVPILEIISNTHDHKKKTKECCCDKP